MTTFMRTTQSTFVRKVSTHEETLAAVQRARADASLPQDRDVHVDDLAAVCPRYWAIGANSFAVFIRQKMTMEQRKELKIREPGGRRKRHMAS